MLVLLSLLGSACDQGSDALLSGDVTAIRVEPAEVEARVQLDVPLRMKFQAWATLTTGEEVALDLISWSLSNLSTGTIDSDRVITTVLMCIIKASTAGE